MTDARDALRWVREKLPKLSLNNPELQVDGEKVIVVGWSTGAVLGLSLGHTPRVEELKTPDAILAFYCPTNYQADCKLY